MVQLTPQAGGKLQLSISDAHKRNVQLVLDAALGTAVRELMVAALRQADWGVRTRSRARQHRSRRSRAQLIAARTVHKPSAVSASEPARCAAAVASAQPGWPRSSEFTTSAEKVENVVRPPSTPVMVNRRHSGDKLAAPGQERDRHADQVAADQIRRERSQRQLRPPAVERFDEAETRTSAEPGAEKDSEQRSGRAHRAGKSAAALTLARPQRFNAASSATRASTHSALPSGRCSFFQNGACVFR